MKCEAAFELEYIPPTLHPHLTDNVILFAVLLFLITSPINLDRPNRTAQHAFTTAHSLRDPGLPSSPKLDNLPTLL